MNYFKNICLKDIRTNDLTKNLGDNTGKAQMFSHEKKVIIVVKLSMQVPNTTISFR
jgi:hypothetical protein